jgi:anti-sigma B factor antagonist
VPFVPDIDVSVSWTAGLPVVAVSGELDIVSGPRLRDALDEVMAGSPGRLVIDLTDVSFLDSSGLGVLVAARKKVRAWSGDVVLVRPVPIVARVLEVTGLSAAFPAYESVPLAVAAPAAQPARDLGA